MYGDDLYACPCKEMEVWWVVCGGCGGGAKIRETKTELDYKTFKVRGTSIVIII